MYKGGDLEVIERIETLEKEVIFKKGGLKENKKGLL